MIRYMDDVHLWIAGRLQEFRRGDAGDVLDIARVILDQYGCANIGTNATVRPWADGIVVVFFLWINVHGRARAIKVEVV